MTNAEWQWNTHHITWFHPPTHTYLQSNGQTSPTWWKITWTHPHNLFISGLIISLLSYPNQSISVEDYDDFVVGGSLSYHHIRRITFRHLPICFYLRFLQYLQIYEVPHRRHDWRLRCGKIDGFNEWNRLIECSSLILVSDKVTLVDYTYHSESCSMISYRMVFNALVLILLFSTLRSQTM